MKKVVGIALIAVIITITFVITCRVFDSLFAEITIDWFAFSAGIFLIAEGLYKIFYSKDPSIQTQLLRVVRVIIGTCIFTIHLLQFMRY